MTQTVKACKKEESVSEVVCDMSNEQVKSIKFISAENLGIEDPAKKDKMYIQVIKASKYGEDVLETILLPSDWVLEFEYEY